MKLLPFILFIILLSSFAYAAPPFQAGAGNDGFDIRAPTAEFIVQGQDGDLHVHVWNKSNGFPILNTDAQCLVHIYNSSGSHILARNMTADPVYEVDWELEIGGGNFTNLGDYPFIIQCNNSNIGGFISSKVIVAPDGEDNTIKDTTAGLSFIIYLRLSSI